MKKRKILHRGLYYRRTKSRHDGWTNREKIFADEWEKENRERPCIDYGMGILQDLMVTETHELWMCLPKKIAFIISRREACIVATVVQWFGSNVGFCFLETCLNKMGYTIAKNRTTLVPKSINLFIN